MAKLLIPTLSPGEEAPMPWKLRLAYAMRCLQGRVRMVGPIDATELVGKRYLEGKVRVYY